MTARRITGATLAPAAVAEAVAVPSAGRLVAAAAVLAVWLGAALLTAAVVAPAAFAVLPTRAGALVGRVLPVVFVGGLVAGAAAAALGGSGGAFGRGRLALAVATAVLCAVAQFGVAPRIHALRAEMGPNIEALATSDPRRRAFGQLHGVSVLLMGAAGLAAGGALVLAALAVARREP